MRDHFVFGKESSLKKQGDIYLEEKIKKMVNNLSHDIDNIIYSRASKSNLSSSSGGNSNIEYSDWLEQDKEKQHHKQQQLILQEIDSLEKLLEDLK